MGSAYSAHGEQRKRSNLGTVVERVCHSDRYRWSQRREKTPDPFYSDPREVSDFHVPPVFLYSVGAVVVVVVLVVVDVEFGGALGRSLGGLPVCLLF